MTSGHAGRIAGRRIRKGLRTQRYGKQQTPERRGVSRDALRLRPDCWGLAEPAKQTLSPAEPASYRRELSYRDHTPQRWRTANYARPGTGFAGRPGFTVATSRPGLAGPRRSRSVNHPASAGLRAPNRRAQRGRAERASGDENSHTSSPVVSKLLLFSCFDPRSQRSRPAHRPVDARRDGVGPYDRYGHLCYLRVLSGYCSGPRHLSREDSGRRTGSGFVAFGTSAGRGAKTDLHAVPPASLTPGPPARTAWLATAARKRTTG